MFCFIHDGICTCSHFMIVLFAGELFYGQPRPKSQHYADVTQYTFVRFGKTAVESWALVWLSVPYCPRAWLLALCLSLGDSTHAICS